MSNSRKIGSRNERQLAAIFTAWTGHEFHRTPASGGLRWGKDKRVTGDLVPDEELSETFPFSIEAKRAKKVRVEHFFLGKKNFLRFWFQAVRDAKTADKIPMVCFRNPNMPRGEYFVVVSTETWNKIPDTWSVGSYMVNDELRIVLFKLSDLVSYDYKDIERAM